LHDVASSSPIGRSVLRELPQPCNSTKVWGVLCVVAGVSTDEFKGISAELELLAGGFIAGFSLRFRGGARGRTAALSGAIYGPQFYVRNICRAEEHLDCE